MFGFKTPKIGTTEDCLSSVVVVLNGPKLRGLGGWPQPLSTWGRPGPWGLCKEKGVTTGRSSGVQG